MKLIQTVLAFFVVLAVLTFSFGSAGCFDPDGDADQGADAGATDWAVTGDELGQLEQASLVCRYSSELCWSGSCDGIGDRSIAFCCDLVGASIQCVTIAGPCDCGNTLPFAEPEGNK